MTIIIKFHMANGFSNHLGMNKRTICLSRTLEGKSVLRQVRKNMHGQKLLSKMFNVSL